MAAAFVYCFKVPERSQTQGIAARSDLSSSLSTRSYSRSYIHIKGIPSINNCAYHRAMATDYDPPPTFTKGQTPQQILGTLMNPLELLSAANRGLSFQLAFIAVTQYDQFLLREHTTIVSDKTPMQIADLPHLEITFPEGIAEVEAGTPLEELAQQALVKVLGEQSEDVNMKRTQVLSFARVPSSACSIPAKIVVVVGCRIEPSLKLLTYLTKWVYAEPELFYNHNVDALVGGDDSKAVLFQVALEEWLSGSSPSRPGQVIEAAALVDPSGRSSGGDYGLEPQDSKPTFAKQSAVSASNDVEAEDGCFGPQCTSGHEATESDPKRDSVEDVESSSFSNNSNAQDIGQSDPPVGVWNEPEAETLSTALVLRSALPVANSFPDGSAEQSDDLESLPDLIEQDSLSAGDEADEELRRASDAEERRKRSTNSMSVGFASADGRFNPLMTTATDSNFDSDFTTVNPGRSRYTFVPDINLEQSPDEAKSKLALGVRKDKDQFHPINPLHHYQGRHAALPATIVAGVRHCQSLRRNRNISQAKDSAIHKDKLTFWGMQG